MNERYSKESSNSSLIKYVVILILTQNILFTNAQSYSPLITNSIVWDVLIGDASQICNYSEGMRCRFSGDSTIQGEVYHKILCHPIVPAVLPGPFCPPFLVDANIDFPFYTLLREDTNLKKVYSYDTFLSKEDLLYDFSLLPTDTLKAEWVDLLLTSPPILDSIVYVNTMNGNSRKAFYFNNGEYYIESIGGSQGLQFPIIDRYIQSNDPICTKINGIIEWGGNCLGVVHTYNQPDARGIAIYPNPSSAQINVVFGSPISGDICITDLLGNTCIQIKQEQASQQLQIDVSSFKPGIYHLLFTDAKASRSVSRFVISSY
jgi:hypothetical protein